MGGGAVRPGPRGLATMMQDIMARVGDEFTVALDGSPTTGFTWELTRGDPERVSLLGSDWAATSGVAGGPGRQVFRLRGIAPGTAQLEFSYKRSWEHRARERRTITVRLTGIREEQAPG